jgi:hypothetical protein
MEEMTSLPRLHVDVDFDATCFDSSNMTGEAVVTTVINEEGHSMSGQLGLDPIFLVEDDGT